MQWGFKNLSLCSKLMLREGHLLVHFLKHERSLCVASPASPFKQPRLSPQSLRLRTDVHSWTLFLRHERNSGEHCAFVTSAGCAGLGWEAGPLAASAKT